MINNKGKDLDDSNFKIEHTIGTSGIDYMHSNARREHIIKNLYVRYNPTPVDYAVCFEDDMKDILLSFLNNKSTDYHNIQRTNFIIHAGSLGISPEEMIELSLHELLTNIDIFQLKKFYSYCKKYCIISS
jgi:hypothetical protein